jgi:endonuclease YncB( thermonuclease family)
MRIFLKLMGLGLLVAIIVSSILLLVIKKSAPYIKEEIIVKQGIPKSGKIKIHEIVRVYDGDTVYITIQNLPPVFGENIGVRIPGIDTPEMRVSTKLDEETRQCLKAMAEQTKNDLKKFILSGKKWELNDSSVDARGKYFRILSDILVDGQSAQEYMLKSSSYVKPYGGGTKEEWTCQK